MRRVAVRGGRERERERKKKRSCFGRRERETEREIKRDRERERNRESYLLSSNLITACPRSLVLICMVNRNKRYDQNSLAIFVNY